MNKHQVKGMANRASGEVKEQVGKATGDRSLEAKGHAQELKGKVQSGYGNAKEEVKRADRESLTDAELARRQRNSGD